MGQTKFFENFDYGYMPLLLRFRFLDKLKVFLNAGPYVSYLIKQTEIIEAFSTLSRTEDNNTENFHRFDFGLCFGAGTRIPIESGLNITLELRENYGLFNVWKGWNYNGDKIFLKSIGIMVGLEYQW